MVRAGLAFLLCLHVGAATAVTPDELRQLTEEGAQERRDSAGRFKVDRMEQHGASKPGAPRSNKHSRNNESPAVNAPTPAPAPARANVGQQQPNAGLASGGFVVDATKVDASKQFGIRMGSWIKARVNRNTSSADPGFVELAITQEIAGDRRSLAPGTLLFARKVFNSGTSRMDLYIMHGITPEGLEFKVKGLAYDQSKVAGLPGVIIADTSEVAKKGATSGMLAAARSVVDRVAGETIAGTAVNAAAGSMVSDGQSIAAQSAKQTVNISVAPQPVFIQVEETF